MSGGWAAKELTERGLKTLVLERGRDIDPDKDFQDLKLPWERPHLDMVPQVELQDYYLTDRIPLVETSKFLWTKHDDQPYETAPGTSYHWLRGYHLGGRSITWARVSLRWNEQDFENNLRDGHGVDWPIRYSDIAPWYDRVEKFIGVAGTSEGLPNLPDGIFQRGWEMTCAEKHLKERVETAFPTRKMIIGRVANLSDPTEEQLELGRSPCQIRSYCSKGCSFRAYFSSVNATLPAAKRTGNLTVIPNAICHSLVYDDAQERVTGVRIIDSETKESRVYSAKIVFLCGSTIPSAMILMSSLSEAFPKGLGNRSDQVGRNLMDHVSPYEPIVGTVPGYLDRYYKGRRPAPAYIPRYANYTENEKDFVRGFGYQIMGMREGVSPGIPGVGEALKLANREPGPWRIRLMPQGEVLPNPENRVTLHPTRTDKWGMPIAYFDVRHGENEIKMMRAAVSDAIEMLKVAGCTNIRQPKLDHLTPSGDRIHEMGSARMGRDPATSVLNGFNQCHDVKNLFITDGACMASTSSVNPSLTYMALTARAANYAADLLAKGEL